MQRTRTGQKSPVFKSNLKSNSLVGTLKSTRFLQWAGTALQESQPTQDQDTNPTAAGPGKHGWQGLHSSGTSRPRERAIKNHTETFQELPPKAGLASSILLHGRHVCCPSPLEQASVSSGHRSRFPELFLAGTRELRGPWISHLRSCSRAAQKRPGHATLLCYSQALPAAVSCLLNKQE